MVSQLGLSFINSNASYFTQSVKGHIELQNLSNIVFSSENVGKESLRLRNAYNQFDGMSKRTSVSEMELQFRKSTDVEVGIGERCNIAEIGTYEVLEGLFFNDTTGVFNRQCVIDFLGFCSIERRLELGKICHGLVMKKGLVGDKFVGTSLVNMYAKCSEMDNAVMVYNQMPNSDVASCNCLISAYASNGLFDKAFGFFIELCNLGIWINHYTYSIMLTVCGNLLAIQEGRQFHAHLVKMKNLSQTAVANALLTMYSKCGVMEEAERLFQSLSKRNLVSWTAIMSGFYQHKALEKALRQFYLMREDGIAPNEHTYTIALASCGSMKHLDCARALHGQVIKSGMISNAFVGTAAVDMYAELGERGDAERKLQEIQGASNVSWNALLAGFVRSEKIQAALEAFHRMVKDDIACDEFTYSITLKACSSLPTLATCKQIHSRVIKFKFGTDLHVGSSLIEGYAKCGNLKDAEQVFYELSTPDVVTWNSMIKAYSQYGHPKKAIFLFGKMVEGKTQPNSSTFLAILSACSHSGLVEEGQDFFESMVRDYKIPLEVTHYSCVVDLLGRSGQLEKALEFIKNLPIKPTAQIWRPLLAACRSRSNLELAELVGKHILALDPKDATVYVTLSNMYAELGRSDDTKRQRELMELNEVMKEPGCSWMEVNNTTYTFFSCDKTHPEMPKVYEILKQLMMQIKDIKCPSNSTPVIHEKKEQFNEGKILYHSEKLAVCFGLISLPAGTPIRIFKNLRVCLDCHSTMKHMSRITERDILLRDNYRFHHFKQGSCTCGDFW